MELACKFGERALEMEPGNSLVLDTVAPLLLETGNTDKAIEISSIIQKCKFFFNMHHLSYCSCAVQIVLFFLFDP